jgi:hypothetical protein
MLEPARYLTDGDYLAGLPKVAQMDTVESAIAQLFSHEGEFSPQQTAAATYTALLASEHLNEEITYNARRHPLANLARLLHGLNFPARPPGPAPPEARRTHRQAHLSRPGRPAHHDGSRRSSTAFLLQ